MNLDSLKPAWKQYQLQSSLQGLHPGEVLKTIESTNRKGYFNSRRLLANGVLFLILLICCQGG